MTIYSALLPVPLKESKQKVSRHKWAEKKSTFRSIRMRCQKCGLERDSKSNEDGYHWVEYRRADENWARNDKTPECQPYMTSRRFELEAAANAKGWFWNEEMKKWCQTGPNVSS